MAAMMWAGQGRSEISLTHKTAIQALLQYLPKICSRAAMGKIGETPGDPQMDLNAMGAQWGGDPLPNSTEHRASNLCRNGHS